MSLRCDDIDDFVYSTIPNFSSPVIFLLILHSLTRKRTSQVPENDSVTSPSAKGITRRITSKLIAESFRASLRGSRATGGESPTVDQGLEEQAAVRREAGQDSTIPHARAIPSGPYGSRRRRVRLSLEEYAIGGILLEQQRRRARGEGPNDMFTIPSRALAAGPSDVLPR